MTRICLQIIFFLFCLPLSLLAQSENADSLLNQINQHKTQDTVMVNLLNQYAYAIANIDHTKAFQKATEAYTLAHHLNYKSGIAWAAVRISTFHAFYTMAYDKATMYALEALKVGEAIHDKNVQSKAYTYMAVCYSKTNDSLSMSYMQRAVSLAEEGGDDDNITFALLNLSIANYEQKNYGISLKLLERALVLAQKMGNVATIMGVYANLGRVYEAMNNPEAALENYEKGIVSARKQKNYRFLSLQILHVGRIYHSRKNMAMALQYGLQSLQIAEENHLIENRRDAYFSLSRIYRDIGKYKEAYTYQNLYSTTADSINNLHSVQNMEQMQQKFKLEKEQLLAEQLVKDQEQKTFNQFLAIGLGIVALAIFVVLISGSIVVRPQMVKLLGVLGLLITFEFFNLILHPFLERITHHTPVLMLACLAGIAGLLIPIHHRLEKWVTLKLVEKNKKRHLATARKMVAMADNITEIEKDSE